MGKVQAAFEIFRAKVRPRVALAGRLRIPTQQDPNNSDLPSDASGLESWCESLGDLTSPTSIESLTSALQNNNRTHISPVVRMQIMQKYEQIIADVLHHLDRRYLYFDLPLYRDSESAFNNAALLSQEMAYGYKIALVDATHGRGKLPKHKQTLAISRVLEHLTQFAYRHSQIYRQWPADIWCDTHALMQIIPTLASQQKAEKPNNIVNQYARLCALHIFDNNHLQTQQLQTLFERLTTHAQTLTFHSTPTGTGAHHYCISGDGPPSLTQFTNSAGLRYFSIESLLKRLVFADDTDDCQLHRNTAAIESLRQDARAPRMNTITAQTGLKEIYTVIRIAPPTAVIESQFTDITELVAQAGNSATTEKDLLNSVNTSEFGSGFDVRNQSSSGFGLKWTGSGSCKIQIGELLAHCYRSGQNERSWHLAVVRWLKSSSDNTLRFGVESITEHADAVQVHRLLKSQDRDDTAIEALLANCQLIDSKAKMLILPPNKFKPGETVGYRDNNGFHLVKLVENVKLNGNFQCFAVQKVAEESFSEQSARAVY